MLTLGAPIAWWALRACHPLALALFSVIGMASVAGFTKAEVERVWLFLAPLACLAAAARCRRAALRSVLLLLATQALAYELVWNTIC